MSSSESSLEESEDYKRRNKKKKKESCSSFKECYSKKKEPKKERIEKECEDNLKTQPCKSKCSTENYKSKLQGSISPGSKGNDTYGPALPPHLTKATSSFSGRLVGPTLPTDSQHLLESDKVYQTSGSDEDPVDFVGPLPQNKSHTMTEAQLQLEKRALEIKLGKLESSKSCKEERKTREEWMLELPEVKSLGPTNRKFQIKERPDFSDRSCWTDTPQSKANELEKTKKVASELHVKERDDEQERLAKKQKEMNKRDKSLLEIHRKKLKKQKKESKLKKLERRPFSREVDLQTSHFDQARTNSVIKKAQLLDTRFASGKAKYL